MKRFLQGILRLFTSFGMACVILLLLCLLTYLGTIAQIDLGLYEAQNRYFASWVVFHPVFRDAVGTPLFSIPLPGVMLLLVLFSINLILGGLLRLRRRPSYAGLFVVHGGILFLLLGGLVTHAIGYDGQMTLAPGQSSNRFSSYHDWELAVVDSSPADSDLEYAVSQNELSALRGSRLDTFQFDALPFDIVAGPWFPNARVLPKGPMFDAPTPVVDGFFVQPLARDPQIEANLPALYIVLIDKRTGEQRPEILWGRSTIPLVVEADGQSYQVSLRHITWTLPFAIQLNKFTREFHPGTRQPRHFQSDVVKHETDGQTRNIIIRMNEPLRTEGYVFFQASFIEDYPTPGVISSTLAVAKNPADQFPLYACIIITTGMLLHFGARLIRHLRRQREQPA
jgi:hypothetical protein